MRNDNLLTMSQAAREIPGRPNVATVWRWCRRGVGGKRLKARRIGSRWFTTVPEIKQFLDACNADVPTCAEADQELAAAGL